MEIGKKEHNHKFDPLGLRKSMGGLGDRNCPQ